MDYIYTFIDPPAEQEGSDTLFSEVFAIFWAVVAYFTPVTLFLVFYTRIILSLRNKRIQVKRVIDNEIVGGSSRRLGSKRNGSTRTGVASTAGGVANQTSASLAITVSTLRITKCAITVTCIFICTVSRESTRVVCACVCVDSNVFVMS